METIQVREIRIRIGKAIQKLRQEEGVSAQFLAKVINVTQPTISRIEAGIASISAENLCVIAKNFNKPLSYFLGEQSSLVYNEKDILRAGLVYYGATHLKSKRNIFILHHYRTYADFLNSALNEVSDSRFTNALAATLFFQAYKNELNETRIISTVTHERLIKNLFDILIIILAAENLLSLQTLKYTDFSSEGLRSHPSFIPISTLESDMGYRSHLVKSSRAFESLRSFKNNIEKKVSFDLSNIKGITPQSVMEFIWKSIEKNG